MTPILSIAQQFGEAIQVSALFSSQEQQAAKSFKTVSLSVWFDSDLNLVQAAVKNFHALGCKVHIKRHVDRATETPYRLSYYRMPWFYAELAAKVRSALVGYLTPGDAIEIANEPAYGASDGLIYADNLPVWRDLFTAISFDDRQAFPGVEIIGPLPNGGQPEVVLDMLDGLNLDAQAFQAFDSVSSHLYPNASPVAGRVAQLKAFSAWSGKPVRITECGADGRLGAAFVDSWIASVNQAANANGILSVDWWSSVAPFDGFSLDLLNNPQFVAAIVGAAVSTP